MLWYHILIISVLWREKKVYSWVLLASQASPLGVCGRLSQKGQGQNGLVHSMKVSGAKIGKRIYFRMIYALNITLVVLKETHMLIHVCTLH